MAGKWKEEFWYSFWLLVGRLVGLELVGVLLDWTGSRVDILVGVFHGYSLILFMDCYARGPRLLISL